MWSRFPPAALRMVIFYSFVSTISSDTSEILRWRVRLLQPFRPRIVSFRRKYPDFIISTDASFKDGIGRVAAFCSDVRISARIDMRSLWNPAWFPPAGLNFSMILFQFLRTIFLRLYWPLLNGGPPAQCRRHSVHGQYWCIRRCFEYRPIRKFRIQGDYSLMVSNRSISNMVLAWSGGAQFEHR